MGEQKFQIQETLVRLDDSQKSLTISIDNGPSGMKDLKIDFSVNGDNESSEIVVSNEFEHTPESEQMIKGILNMICTGLKNYHEQWTKHVVLIKTIIIFIWFLIRGDSPTKLGIKWDADMPIF